MPDSNKNDSKLIVELKLCSRCNNPFMVKKGEKLEELICENCKKLEQRKNELQIGVFENVIEVENKMENSINKLINEMKDHLTITKGKFNKQHYLDIIKRRSELLRKSIELVEKIEATSNEKYIEEYKKLFEKMKEEHD